MEEPHWYVLNYITRGRGVSSETTAGRYAASTGERLEVFAPTYIEMIRRDNGDWVRAERPLLYHYVFVRGTESAVKGLCGSDNGFSLILNRASEGGRYLTMSPVALENFRTLSRCYRSSIPCYLTDEVDLCEGDLVEIASGEFVGVRGRYVPKKGGRSGYVTLSVTQGMHALVLGVKSDYIRILAFGRNSRRVYDQLDAYLPRLLAALRTYRTGAPLGPRDLAPVEVFVRRMGLATLPAGKARTKLHLLLWASYTLLGDEANAIKIRNSLSPTAMSAPWAQAIAGHLYSQELPG